MTRTAGVAAVGHILSRLGCGEHVTPRTLAEEDGLARSTVFDVVRRLEQADFLTRHSALGLAAGAAAACLGLSAWGLNALLEPIEATLLWLADHVGAPVGLVVPPDELLLFEVRGTWQPRARDAVMSLYEKVQTADGIVVARLRVTLPSRTPAQDIAFAKVHLGRACATLEAYLQGHA